MNPTDSESSSWSSTAFRHRRWESLDLVGRIYAGALTTTLGFLAHWSYQMGDPTAVAVLLGVWILMLGLLRTSTCYRTPSPPAARPRHTPNRPPACYRHTIHHPVGPTPTNQPRSHHHGN